MEEFNKKIIFMQYNDKCPSHHMRIKQIADILNNSNIIINFVYENDKQKIKMNNKLKKYKNSLFIWIKNINIDIINMVNKSNNHIYDLVDNYLYKKNEINNILNNNLINGLIVNNKFTLNHIYSTTSFFGIIDVIYHHYDPIYETAILTNQNKLIFGYMGSIPSLYHTDNFLYYKDLINIFPIELLNTENREYYTNKIKNNIKINSNNQLNLKKININFNCHISIRKIDSDVFKFKTTAKIATASILNHNIITTYEESVKDILTDDYPFIIKNDDFDSVKKMFELVINDYNTSKILWNKGLDIMKKVKYKLNLNNIKNDYIKMISRYI